MIHDGEWFHIGTQDGLDEAEPEVDGLHETKHR